MRTTLDIPEAIFKKAMKAVHEGIAFMSFGPLEVF